MFWSGPVAVSGACSGVSRRFPVAVSAAGFAWQGQHLGTLSVVCVAGGPLCSSVSRRVLVVVSEVGFA